MQPLLRKRASIDLLPAEDLLSQLLLDCRNGMISADPSLSDLKIWFVGGWVRDEMLGITSPDIDIALSILTGIQFGEALKDFYSSNGHKYEQKAQKLGLPSKGIRKVHKVPQNLEQAKQLETAKIRIFGLDVDLVNLRKETYTDEGGRVPWMEFGSAKEDALRRDATVNALFYDLDTQEIEDFTKAGLNDMAAGIIRTPLEPYQTFKDDPFRILRAIRFASRLEYTIEGKSQEAIKSPEIHAAFRQKINRERVGPEITKMINGRNPLMAFQLIYELDLYSTVFLTQKIYQAMSDSLPDQGSDHPWPFTWPHAFQVLSGLLEDTTTLGKELAQSQTNEHCWMMAAYAPIAESGCTKPAEAVKDVRKAINLTTQMSKLLEDALTHLKEIQSIVTLTATGASNLPRSTVGMAIRSWGVSWRLQVLYSLLAEIVYETSAERNVFPEQLERYSKFVGYVLQQDLQDAAVVKPILNGSEVVKLFDLKRSGRFMKGVIEGIVRWQFDNRASSREEVENWLRAQKDPLGIP